MPSFKKLQIAKKRNEETPVNTAADIAGVAKPLRKKKVKSYEAIMAEEIRLMKEQLTQINEASQRALTEAGTARTMAALTASGSSGGGYGTSQINNLIQSSITTALGSVNPGFSLEDNDVYREYSNVTSLSAHRVIIASGPGVFTYADCTNPTHAMGVLGLTTNAGTTVKVLYQGDLQESSWNYTVGSPIFLGENGNLVEGSPPINAKFTLLVGHVVDTDTIAFSFGNPSILLSS